MTEWQATLPAGAPNHFLINIQPAEREALGAMLVARRRRRAAFTPLVRARISHVNGVPVDDYPARHRARPRRARGRDEPHLVGRAAAATTSSSRASGGARAPRCRSSRSRRSCAPRSASSSATRSRTRSAAKASRCGSRARGACSGSRSGRISSWSLSPGAIEQFAHTYITSLYVAPEQRRVTVDLVRQFPSVSVFDIGAVLDQVRRSMDRAALAVQYVFLFTLAAGVMVLLAAIQATRDERMFESAVLRTLGARRSVVLQGVAAEFTALGLLAGTLAAVGAAVDRLRHRDAAVPARLRARYRFCGSAGSSPERSSSASAARSPCAPSSTTRRSPLCAAPERCARYHAAPRRED